MKNKGCRPIQSNLKSYRIVNPTEKSSRWNFMKILREYSNLKEFYPEIDPYVEVYWFRENLAAIYSEGLTVGCSDMWSYLIIGPKKAMLIDTGYGVGNLKALCEYLANGKEIVCVNTHYHVDHSAGNPAFDKVYIHEYDVEHLEKSKKNRFDNLFNENGEPKDTFFDKNDLVPDSDYEIIGFKDGDFFDLGDGYLVEVKHLPGHTPGQSAFYDHQNHCLFIGDTTSCVGPQANERYPEYCTIQALKDGLEKILVFADEIAGVFPGHGTIDLHPLVLEYTKDTAERILKHPEQYDTKVNFFNREMMAKMIYQQGSDLKYTWSGVGKRN